MNCFSDFFEGQGTTNVGKVRKATFQALSILTFSMVDCKVNTFVYQI